MRIIIGFSRAKAWYQIFSTAIQVAEKRNYSHAYIRYADLATNEEMIAQASHGMVNETNFEIFKESNIVVEEYQIDLLNYESLEIMKFLKKNMGKPYSFKQIALIAIKKLFRVQMNQNNKDQGFICSELASRIIEITDSHDLGNKDFITPSDLNKLIKQISRFKRIK